MALRLFTLLFLCSLIFETKGQGTDTQFPKGWEHQLRLQSGLITNFHNGNDLFSGNLGISSQYTVIPNKIRAGIAIGSNYSNKKIKGLIGPVIDWKIRSFQTPLFGYANFHFSFEHLWSTGNEALAGGGARIELLHKIILGLNTYRDYRNNSWWIQSHIAIRLNKSKTDAQDFNRE